MYDLSIFKRSSENLNISLNDTQIQQYVTYYEYLVEKNKVMNLTGITDFQEVMLKHFIDSLAITKIVDMNKVQTLIDVGTGAGFPGLPIKIAFPHIDVVLLDSLNKRLNFLNEVIEMTKLQSIKTVHGRSEDAGRDKNLREKFDIGVSRAVANMSVLSEYCIPFVKIGGSFIAYKAGGAEEEITEANKAIKTLGGNVKDICKFKLPESDIERTLINVQKIKNTPDKYPRKAGIPVKEPIK